MVVAAPAVQHHHQAGVFVRRVGEVQIDRDGALEGLIELVGGDGLADDGVVDGLVGLGGAGGGADEEACESEDRPGHLAPPNE